MDEFYLIVQYIKKNKFKYLYNKGSKCFEFFNKKNPLKTLFALIIQIFMLMVFDGSVYIEYC
jgi:hypothetical protein